MILAIVIYSGIGALVAAWFLLLRLERSDPSAQGAYAFRPLLVPGLVLLWPLVVWRTAMSSARPHRSFRASHRRLWIALALLLPVLLIGALALRQNGPTEARPERLAAP